MTDKKQTPEPESLFPDLSVLADFQFGPSWARSDAKKDYSSHAPTGRPERSGSEGRKGGRFASRDERPRRDAGERRGAPSERRWGDRPQGQGRQDGKPPRFDRNKGFDRNRDGRDHREQRERPPLPEPAAGLRVELRPVDVGLAACSAEVHKHKRVVSLFDFARIIIGKRDRYDIVFMKQEGGPKMFASKKGDHACWLSRDEALKYIWKASWFDEFYQATSEDVEPPKGEFQAIGKCSLNGALIGPVNWHGYQSAVVNLHRTSFPHMAFDHFRSKIQVEKGEEAVNAWLESVSKRTVWKARREGAGETVLPDPASVEKDFADHHFADVYEETDKVFVNGAVPRHAVSAGLWAHIAILSDLTRKHPSMLIPNLCHGLARHHMPIFKWKGGHHTGPSRPRSLSSDTVLADRMMAIVDWVTKNPGKRVDLMLKELCVPCEAVSVGGETPVEQEPAAEAPTADVDTVPVESAPEMAPVETVPNETSQEETDDSAPVQEQTPLVEPVDKPVEDAPEPEPVQPVSELDRLRQEFVKDLFWLCDQGYVLVFSDGKINLPKAGEKTHADEVSADGGAPWSGKAKKKKPAKAKQQPGSAKGKQEKAQASPQADKTDAATQVDAPQQAAESAGAADESPVAESASDSPAVTADVSVAAEQEPVEIGEEPAQAEEILVATGETPAPQTELEAQPETKPEA